MSDWRDSYDAWKLASPDDDRDDVCDHDDYEVDILEGRARCNRCPESWYVSEEEVCAKIKHQAAYDDYCERENRREFWRRLTYPLRWPIYRILERIWPRKSVNVLYDEEIPF